MNAQARAIRREAFVAAALHLIQVKGYEQMSVQDVLDELDASRGAFYHYFDSKIGLLDAVVEHMVVAATPAVTPTVERASAPIRSWSTMIAVGSPWSTSTSRACQRRHEALHQGAVRLIDHPLRLRGDRAVTTSPGYGVPTSSAKAGATRSGATRRVENGETGTVLATDPRSSTVRVQLWDRVWTVSPKHLPALELGYAQHLYRAQETSVAVADADSLGVAPDDSQAALQALAARWAEAHPAVAATTLAEQAAPAEAAAEAEPLGLESGAISPRPAPGPSLQPGWTLVDEPDRGRARG